MKGGAIRTGKACGQSLNSYHVSSGSIPGHSIWICDQECGSGIIFLPALQFSPVSIIPPWLYTHSFIHLPPTLYNVFLPVLQFSPVSIIPPLLHTHSFISMYKRPDPDELPKAALLQNSGTESCTRNAI